MKMGRRSRQRMTGLTEEQRRWLACLSKEEREKLRDAWSVS